MLKNRFPCGQCMACRLNKQREKALRITHELQYHKDNVFITLTYSSENLPKNGSLIKSDLQKFMKRLRKFVHPDEIRFFGAGEYGELGNRPHYHLIVFGLSMNDKRVFSGLRYVPSQDVYYCICKAWNKGFVSVGYVNTARVNYVAKYVVKKVTGKLSDNYYGEKMSEFCLCSRNPGLGYQYAIDHEARLKQDDYVTVRGVKASVPRYYIEKLYNNVDKIVRSHKRDKFISQEIEANRPEFDKYGAFGYAQLQKDKEETRKRLLGLTIQRKGKSKCQIN